MADEPHKSPPPSVADTDGGRGFALLWTRPLTHVLVVYVAAFAGTALLATLHRFESLADVSSIGIALLFLASAVAIARRDPRGPARYGISLGGVLDPTPPDDPRPAGPLGLFDIGRALAAAAPQGLRELGFALGLAAIIFPPFVAAFWGWNVWLMGAPSHPFRFAAPDLAAFALTQWVVVALPEEAFFRGFVQTRLSDRWPATRSFLGARIHVGALVLQAALFALVHLATEPRLEKLATFFPGLLFGWMRARRGGIGAAMTMHALSNVLAEVLVTGWLR